MFILALFIIGKKWKQPKHPSADEWITKCGLYTHTGILFNHKRNDTLIRATTQINFENILSEISQTQKEIYCMIPRI